jgi:cytoplasmic iron level regulating protein YaaA (DUF328/UPF0246 family)
MLKIIVSPAKKMNVNTEFEIHNMPCFLDKTNCLMRYMKGLNYEEAKNLWKCNDKIAKTSFEYFLNMNITENLTPALLAYEGIQYKYMAPDVFDIEQWDYIENHLYILSGFYGLLKPLDGIAPHRLEMQSAVKLLEYGDLYDYWGDSLYRKLYEDTDIVLNLASKEYSKCIENYLNDQVQFISITFGEYKEGNIITKGTLAKMARGEMVRYMAEEKIDNVSEIKNFNRLGYIYNEEKSNNKNIVFIKK